MSDSRPAPSAAPLLELEGISKTYSNKGLLSSATSVTAARDVSFSLRAGEAVALVGESGSGKSTLAKMVVRLESPDSGALRLAGKAVPLGSSRVPLAYRRRVQMVFQDPFGSLNPAHTVAYHLERPLLRHGLAKRGESRARAVELLNTVGLGPAEDFIDRRPYELSGGQRQRVAIARALAVDPDVLVADEPTSMLDVSIRMGLLGLLARLKKERNLAILLITHDLASARFLADRILVLFKGRIVESGPSASVVSDPAHPYTRALLASIADTGTRELSVDAVEHGLSDSASGCPFISRCAQATLTCVESDPQPRTAGNHQVRCHLYPHQSLASASPGD